MEVPHRYDPKADSCVNEETREFNRKLKSLSEQFANLCVIEISINREVYTRHGLHMNRIGEEQTAEKIATEIGNILKVKPGVQQWEQDENREKSIMGAAKVSSVSDTEVDNVDPLGITTPTPNKQEILSSPSTTVLDLNLSKLEGLLTECANTVSMLSGPKKCDEEIIIVETNTNQGTKGILETTAKEAIPILDLNQNSLEKSLLENTDVISMLSRSNKSDEESNKTATNSELETKDTIDPMVREVTSKLDSNQSNTKGLLTKSTNIVSDTLTRHREPVSIRISNRKKQFPLTKNENFFMGVSSNEVPNKNIDAVFNRSQKSGKKLTTYAVHTNDTHFKKNKHTTMKNSSDNLRIFHQNIRGLQENRLINYSLGKFFPPYSLYHRAPSKRL